MCRSGWGGRVAVNLETNRPIRNRETKLRNGSHFSSTSVDGWRRPPPQKKDKKANTHKMASKLKITEMEDKKKQINHFRLVKRSKLDAGRADYLFCSLFDWERNKKKEQPTNKQRNPKNGGNPVKKNSVKHRLFPNFRVLRWLKVKKKEDQHLATAEDGNLCFFYLLHRSFSARHGFVATSRFSFNARAKKTANFSVEGQKNAQNSFWKHFFCELLIMKRHSFLFGTEMKEETTISLTISR